MTEDIAPDVTPAPEAPIASPELENRARSMGWAPKDNFRGDPEKWVDAETFVKRGEEVLPIVNAQNRQLRQKLEQLEGTLNQLSQHHAKVAEVEYERALTTVRDQMGEAVARGDGEGFKSLRAMEDKILKEQAQPITKSAAGGEDPRFTQWKQANPWYETDPELRRTADVYGQGLLVMGTDPGQVLVDVAAHINKLRKPSPRPHSAVEGGGSGAPRGGGKVKFSDLPSEAQKACKSFVSRNVMTEEKYIAEYIKIDPELKG